MNVDINRLVDQLVQVGKPIATQAWGLLVERQMVIGFQQIGGAIFCFVLAILAAVTFIKFVNKLKKDSWVSGDEIAGCVGLVIGFLICFGIGIGLATDGTLHLLFPGAYAIGDLLGK